ncbi:SOS response-associated peptidase [Aquabacterium sp. A7-Y]|uniref:SOS response-associated peptidase family protein n=1 Tax=Aquabacterium sp. A7-Y TaxID=1349605 RepID=UPI00223DD4E6|nr:SOS response-associated peptidase family protein [Aquabacterium sp. A7-Y]MCW7536276.1 SOS response-associated peptidase [Aquabacterium sp. A7-Y]
MESPAPFARDIGPFGPGVFIRPSREDGNLEEVFGQWGLIGWFAKTPQPAKKPGQRTILTNNARFKTIHKLATYKAPWARGQRCIIPAWSYLEPNWETGKNQWWRFRRPDGQPWGMAGLWNTWIDKETGEVHESYTMVTLNCDDHPLLRRMHRPDPDRPETMQDKRAVVPLHPDAFEIWLRGTVEEAVSALVLPPSESFDAGPDKVSPKAPPPQSSLL